ncbi:MAG: hypothetical protein G01um10148_1013 [Parcubacteria group bacterium Gr01-1014_8]|nr:MAG: hypothetical protein G01um10148_1013 [Parcubacteria group bacterium Gr01-1014_8]
MNNLRDKLLGDIRSGKVAMTPRAYFVAKIVALLAVSLGIVFVTIFIFNFIFFSLRINGHETLLGFGPRGMQAFVYFFPWYLLVLDVALVGLLQWLLRNFRLGYQIPVLYLVAGLLLGAFAFGFALDRGTPLNDVLHEGREHLPRPIGGFYEGAQRSPTAGSGMCHCVILAIDGSTLTVRDTRDSGGEGGDVSTLRITLPPNDRHATTSGLKVGDVIFIAGDESEGVIEAFGIRREDDSHSFFKPARQ